MSIYRKFHRKIKVPCAICGADTHYKSKKHGYKCYNLKCDSRRINKA